MPRKTQDCTKAQLLSVALPTHADTYTVISHEFVINYSYQALAAAGFSVVDEQYRSNRDGQIAHGIYKLNYNNDPELSMMFTWTNSYNKQVKFRCGIGAYINKTGTVMTSGDIGTWVRKHMGSADTDTQNTIDQQVQNAHMYYDQLVADKNSMKDITLNKRRQAQMLGILFAEYDILNTEQVSTVKQLMHKPTFSFENTDSLWQFYNYVTIALQESHPKTWMEDQRILHYFITSVIKSHKPEVVVEPTPVVEVTETVEDLNPDQTDLIEQIAEVEAGVKVVEVEPDDYIIQEDNTELAEDEVSEEASTIEDAEINTPVEEHVSLDQVMRWAAEITTPEPVEQESVPENVVIEESFDLEDDLSFDNNEENKEDIPDFF